jgi:hypothetical protein
MRSFSPCNLPKLQDVMVVVMYSCRYDMCVERESVKSSTFFASKSQLASAASSHRPCPLGIQAKSAS